MSRESCNHRICSQGTKNCWIDCHYKEVGGPPLFILHRNRHVAIIKVAHRSYWPSNNPTWQFVLGSSDPRSRAALRRRREQPGCADDTGQDRTRPLALSFAAFKPSFWVTRLGFSDNDRSFLEEIGR